MSNLTFAGTTLNTRNAAGDEVTYQAGDVIRIFADSNDPFSDCIILGFSQPDKHGDVYVKLARPYAYASSIGTTGPTVLTGAEVFEMPASKLRFEGVVSSHPMVSGPGVAPIDRPYNDEKIDLTGDDGALTEERTLEGIGKIVAMIEGAEAEVAARKAGDEDDEDLTGKDGGTHRVIMRLAAICELCETEIPSGSVAVWVAEKGAIHCTDCPEDKGADRSARAALRAITREI